MTDRTQSSSQPTDTNSKIDKRVAMLGAGKMGSILIEGLIRSGQPEAGSELPIRALEVNVPVRRRPERQANQNRGDGANPDDTHQSPRPVG